ncbi:MULTISPECIES: NAD(P)-dependent oxidoreductase [unclassified Flavobacterium]|uniref:NAD-dependent epimerase/dehydratase family protein n=1 Tax=unclassified Flavobacterium TaxID=196869 RepID=UPI00131ADDA4|nr:MULTISPECIES: SDR family oxidoreductase [unclassified Flavobacterium]
MIGITGASGVLGKIICNKLEKDNIEFSTFNTDIRDDNAVIDWVKNNKLTYIIHLASKVAVSDVENNIHEAYDVNISGTINLIKAIKIHNQPIGFFYASTSHVYESSSKILNESDTVNPINSYGLTKWMSEMLLNDFKKKYSNINLCIGRIFSFYHKSQLPPFLYPNLMKRFEEEDLSKPFKLFGANSTRDFLNAEEACDIIIKLVLGNYEGTINIASGKSIKIIDFAQKMAPQKINFDFDDTETVNHLNADISLLNSIIKND